MSHTKHTEELTKRLTSLRNSCLEGQDGTWDPIGNWTEDSPFNEGFGAMAEDAERIAELLGIELPEYVKETEED
jgi:hypothetical protein